MQSRQLYIPAYEVPGPPSPALYIESIVRSLHVLRSQTPLLPSHSSCSHSILKLYRSLSTRSLLTIYIARSIHVYPRPPHHSRTPSLTFYCTPSKVHPLLSHACQRGLFPCTAQRAAVSAAGAQAASAKTRRKRQQLLPYLLLLLRPLCCCCCYGVAVAATAVSAICCLSRPHLPQSTEPAPFPQRRTPTYSLNHDTGSPFRPIEIQSRQLQKPAHKVPPGPNHTYPRTTSPTFYILVPNSIVRSLLTLRLSNLHCSFSTCFRTLSLALYRFSAPNLHHSLSCFQSPSPHRSIAPKPSLDLYLFSNSTTRFLQTVHVSVIARSLASVNIGSSRPPPICFVRCDGCASCARLSCCCYCCCPCCCVYRRQFTQPSPPPSPPPHSPGSPDSIPYATSQKNRRTMFENLPELRASPRTNSRNSSWVWYLG